MAIVTFPGNGAWVGPAKGASVIVRGVVLATEGRVYAGVFNGWGYRDRYNDSAAVWYLNGPMGGVQYYYADAYQLETLED